MEYKLKAYTIWDCGKRVDAEGKPHQEDSIFPADEQTTEQDRLFILCDGMGGHEAGEVASATVCEAMSKSILSAEPNAEGNFTDDALTQALADAYDALDAKDNNTSGRKMGTTMTLMKLHNKGCTIAHIGDSRVYHIRPGKTAKDTEILFRTEDHSLVNELVKAGELTPEEAKHSRQKNVITRAMQPHLTHRPKADVYHTVDIRPNDYFYLCSDGMLENMEDHQLCYFFSDEAGDDPHKVSSLVKATRENSDNHSAIIVHISDVLHPLPIPKETPKREDKIVFSIRDEQPSRVTPIQKPQKKAKSYVGIIALVVACLIVIAVCYLKPSQKTEVKTTEPARKVQSLTKPPKEEAKVPIEKTTDKTMEQITNAIDEVKQPTNITSEEVANPIEDSSTLETQQVTSEEESTIGDVPMDEQHVTDEPNEIEPEKEEPNVQNPITI